jgi:diadenylate cyclase
MDRIILFLSTIRWQDVFDIALSGYLLFRLYVLFRGTNVFRILIGIALLWFFQRISVSIGLIVTSWAIQGITAVAALIIIVVFRNEIRSVLQAKNLKSIFWGFPREAALTPLEVITDSAFELAKKRIGALLVLPGNEDLTEAVHSGISWNGLVSQEMIMSIFWHDNPVHDGAAIIQGDQVKEVGVVLPLSHREDLPSAYGTRHRAAAGLAETTDALVIVVSEEKGRVSVAKGTDIRAVRQKDKLNEILQNHVGVSTKHWGRIKKEKLELGFAAVVSFIFIAGVWFSFSRGMDTLMILDIPIEYMNRPAEMEIIRTSSNDVSVELTGSGALMRSLKPDQVNVRLDLAKAAVGTNTFDITPENVSLPPGVFLKDIQTDTVQVTLDVPIRRELPVQIDWAGALPKDLLISEASYDPQVVQVLGSRRILDNLSTIYTEKVSVDNITESGTMTVKLALNPASLRIAPGSKDRVTINYVVRKREAENG